MVPAMQMIFLKKVMGMSEKNVPLQFLGAVSYL